MTRQRDTAINNLIESIDFLFTTTEDIIGFMEEILQRRNLPYIIVRGVASRERLYGNRRYRALYNLVAAVETLRERVRDQPPEIQAQPEASTEETRARVGQLIGRYTQLQGEIDTLRRRM